MKKTVYELIKANAEVLRELTSAGVAIEDYKNIELYEDFVRWFESDPRAEPYRHLRWDAELEEARRKEAEAKA